MDERRPLPPPPPPKSERPLPPGAKRPEISTNHEPPVEQKPKQDYGFVDPSIPEEAFSRRPSLRLRFGNNPEIIKIRLETVSPKFFKQPATQRMEIVNYKYETIGWLEIGEAPCDSPLVKRYLSLPKWIEDENTKKVTFNPDLPAGFLVIEAGKVRDWKLRHAETTSWLSK